MVACVVERLDPVTADPIGALAGMDLMSPYVWHDGARYRMLLRGVPHGGDTPTGVIGLARRADGLTFAVDDRPAIASGPAGDDDAGGCEDPTVLVEGERKLVWYTGVDTAHRQSALMLAEGTLRDGFTKREVRVKAPEGEGNIKEATLARTPAGDWRLFFEYAAKDASRIGVARANTPEGPWTSLDDPFGIRGDGRDDWHLSTGPIVLPPGGGDPVTFYNGATRDARWRFGWVSFAPDFHRAGPRDRARRDAAAAHGSRRDRHRLCRVGGERRRPHRALLLARGSHAAPRADPEVLMSAAPQIGISEFTTMPWSFEHDVERYAANGVDAIEIVEAKLDHDRLAEQFAMVRDAGLPVSGVQPAVRTFLRSRMMPEPSGLDERIACLRRSIETIAPFCPGVPFITNTGAHPKGNMADAMCITTDALRTLASVAADNGVRLALEPLNPSSVNVESAIWTIDQSLSVIAATGRDEVGLCLDYWNVWQQADIVGAIARAGDRIFTAQASDWRTPRSFADRIVPGDGEIPLAALVRETRRASFTGPIVVEIFSNDVPDSLYSGDVDAVVARCVAAMGAILATTI